MKVRILWSNNKTSEYGNWQEKTFDDEISALEWCRRNSKHIQGINESRLFLEENISHFDIIDALRNN